MTGFNYLINLTVINGGAFGKLASMAGGFENSLDRVQGEVGQTQSKLNNLGNTGRSVFSGLRSSVMGWVAGLGIAAATLGSLNTTANISSLDTAITFAGGAEGAANLAYVEQTAARLNTPLMAAKEGFKVLTGSMIGTNITALQQRDIFDSVAVASRVMGLSADNTTGAILALGQMASKGKVQAEELRGQLGERIPGAFGIAARAMGVTTTELDKMMEQGKLVAEDFLPKFAAEMQRTFGPGLEAAMNTPRAQFDKFGNSILNLKELVGTQLMPTATALINDVFIPMVDWIGKNIEALKFMGTVLGTLYVAAKLYAFGSGIAALATGTFEGTVWGLNAALWANPITWVVGLIIAIGAAVVYAWNYFEGFRGFLFSLWAVLKETGNIVWDYLIAPLAAIGETLLGVLTHDPKLIAKGITDSVSAAQKILNSASIGDRLGNAMDTGWNKGIANFNGYDVPIADDRWDYYNQRRDDALGGAAFGGSAPGAGTGKGNNKASEISNSITGGGQRNVTINVGKLNEGGITINTTNLKEGSTEVEAMLMKLMLQVVNSGNQQQGK